MELHSIGLFTNKPVYRALCNPCPKFIWLKVIWERWTLLEHNLLAWQVVSNALLTQDMLKNWGMLDQSSCCFLNHEDESIVTSSSIVNIQEQSGAK